MTLARNHFRLAGQATGKFLALDTVKAAVRREIFLVAEL